MPPPGRIYRVPLPPRMGRSLSTTSHTGDWAHGLCGCFDNAGLCVFTFCCPCFIFGQNAKHVGEDCVSMGVCFMLPPFSFMAHLAIRGKIREKRDITGSVLRDMAAVTCCGPCALVQDTQEVHDMIGVTGGGGQDDQTTMDRI